MCVNVRVMWLNHHNFMGAIYDPIRYDMRNWYVFVGSLPQVPGDLFCHGIKILIHLLFSLSSCVPSRVRITQLWNINWSCDGFHHRRPLPTPRNGPTVISPLQN